MERPADVSNQPLVALPPRPRTAHKGDFGRVTLVAGSRSMPGAAALAAEAALRSGAGLVTVATAADAAAVVAGHCACSTLRILAQGPDGTALAANFWGLMRDAPRCDAWGVGPGLGSSSEARQLAVRLYAAVAAPMAMDADGLNALAASPAALERPGGPRILTPHAGEFARLIGEPAAADAAHRAAQAAALCRRDPGGRTVVLLKGSPTLVVAADRYAVHAVGNPGMATGGTGDCLTGVLTALVGQGIGAWDAARLAAEVHGAAGDLAAAAVGERSLTASDLLEFLPQAWQARDAAGRQ